MQIRVVNESFTFHRRQSSRHTHALYLTLMAEAQSTSVASPKEVGRRGSSFKNFTPGQPKNLAINRKSSSSGEKKSRDSSVLSTSEAGEREKTWLSPVLLGVIIFAVLAGPLVMMFEAAFGKRGR